MQNMTYDFENGKTQNNLGIKMIIMYFLIVEIALWENGKCFLFLLLMFGKSSLKIFETFKRFKHKIIIMLKGFQKKKSSLKYFLIRKVKN